MRFLKPAFEALGKRIVIKPSVNKLALFTQHLLWFTHMPYYYLNEFQSQLAQLTESGIYDRFRNKYDKYLQKQALLKFNSTMKKSQKMNSLFSEIPSNGNEQKESFSFTFEAAKLEAIKVVTYMWSAFCLIRTGIFVLEHIFK